MKIKGRFENLKIESAFYIFAVATGLALGLRIWQSLNIIDHYTGFFIKRDITVSILYGILILGCVGVIAVCFLCGSVPKEGLPRKKSIFIVIYSAFMMLSLFADGVFRFRKAFDLFSKYNAYGNEQSFNAYLMKSGSLPMFLEAVFALFCIVWFLLILLQYAGVKEIDVSNYKFFSVCPVLWGIFRMIQRFTRTISFANVSGLLLELFMIAFMMLFFMYFAQSVTGINSKAISYKIFAYGLCGSMLAVVVSVPRIVLTFVNPMVSYLDLGSTVEVAYRSAGDIMSCPLEWCDTAFAVFALGMLVLLLSNVKIKNMTLKETEKIEKELSEEAVEEQAD